MKLILLIILLVPVVAFTQTTIILQPHYADGGNSYIRSNLPVTPILGPADLTAYAWTCGGYLCNGRGFFKMPLDEIPVGAIIDSAKLYLYANTTTGIGFGGDEPQTGANSGTIYRVTEAWDNETLTWGNQPEISTENSISISESIDPVQDYILDATLMVQDMINLTTESFGFTIRLDDESDYYSSLIFASSYNFYEDKHPKLVVTYTIPINISSHSPNEFKIYPNPTSNYFVVEFSNPINENSIIEICDITGKVVSTIDIPLGLSSFQCDIQNLNSGMYFVRMNNYNVSSLQVMR